MAKDKTTAPKADEFDKILDGLEKQFGDGNIFNGEDALLKDKRIMLSAPRLSWAYGGSFKLNAIHRLNGTESSGKTTLATYLAAECQRAKFEETKDWGYCHVVVLDNERTFDISHAKDLGLHITNPETGKPLLHVCRNLYVDDQEVAYEKMVVSGKVCCCIYDSDAAGIDKASFGEVGSEDLSKANFGSSAKASGTVIKRMNYFVDRYSTPVIWISQERANMCVSKNTIVDYKRLDTSKVQSTIKELFKTEFDLDMEEMEPLKVYNVEEANIGILAYDESKGENVYSKIISCIKKPLTAATSIKIEGRTSFEEAVSDNHMYAVYIEDSKAIDYAYARDLKKGCQVFTLNGFKKIVDIQKREKEDWFDIQTETGNYYANGILSHNSPMSHLNAITGGMAVNFYPSTRFRVSAREPITRNGEMVGIKIKIKNYKNKTGIPNRECLLDLYFHDGPDYKAGIDGESQYLDMALELGLVTQHGAWYYYRENDPNPENLVKCQGWGGLQTWFKENKDEFEKIKVEINAKMSCYDENLDKNSVEIDEVEAIKQEAIETAKRKAVNTEKLAEEAMQNSEEGSSETTVENTVE